jgi:colanic acid/amylovoran biosynthesis glycosyltransferase
MLTISYLANKFPVPVEPYVGAEIEELRRRGVTVIAGSVSKTSSLRPDDSRAPEIITLKPIHILTLLRALGTLARHWTRISGILHRVLLEGNETPLSRAKALLHVWLGAYYAIRLQGKQVDHIHVHHGYFGSFVGMVAARLLRISFSLTLHGSDLLLHAAHLDTKLSNCRFCITISEYNRRYILGKFPEIDSRKIHVSRLGVETPKLETARGVAQHAPRPFTILAVGRLHAVKNHTFLIEACAQLRDRGLNFACLIAGEGPERSLLESLVQRHHLQDRVTLLGHVEREEIDSLYRKSDLVVLTSHSEGIPLVLMEAMARCRIVLAPAITGIPELIIPGKNGFLYQPGKLNDFVQRILFLRVLMGGDEQLPNGRLDWIRHAARIQIVHNFSREKNLKHFANLFLQQVAVLDRSSLHEDFILQQI